MAKQRGEEHSRDELQPFVFYSYTEAAARLRITRDERDGSLVVEGNRDGLAKLAEVLAGFARSRTDTDHEHWLGLEGDFAELLLDLDDSIKR